MNPHVIKFLLVIALLHAAIDSFSLILGHKRVVTEEKVPWYWRINGLISFGLYTYLMYSVINDLL